MEDIRQSPAQAYRSRQLTEAMFKHAQSSRLKGRSRANMSSSRVASYSDHTPQRELMDLSSQLAMVLWALPLWSGTSLPRA